MKMANSASKALGLLITKFKSAGGMPFSTFTKLFNSTILSIINYGASIWGCRRFTCIKAVQNRALRSFLCVGRYTPNAAVNGDTGWDSVWRCVNKLMVQNKSNGSKQTIVSQARQL